MTGKEPRTFDAETRSDPDFPWLDIDERFSFPDAEDTCGSVVAVGGNLSPGMLISAYTQGIFPWFNEDDPLYWQSPDPRFVITPESFHVPSRLARTVRKGTFTITADTEFEKVVTWCSAIAREDQDGSWITDDIAEAYIRLHRLGVAHSIEAWKDGHLVGGFYGVHLEKSFSVNQCLPGFRMRQKQPLLFSGRSSFLGWADCLLIHRYILIIWRALAGRISPVPRIYAVYMSCSAAVLTVCRKTGVYGPRIISRLCFPRRLPDASASVSTVHSDQ